MRKVKFEQILILGTGTLALQITKFLATHHFTRKNISLLCASYKESPFSLFGSYCKNAGIPYSRFKENASLTHYLTQLESQTLIISANNYYLFPFEILQNPLLKVINFHNSLLPKHRGLNAQMWSIFEQDKRSGITWHCVDSGIDSGEIIIQKPIILDSTHTYLKLTQEQLALGFSAFIEVCDSILSWNQLLSAQEIIKGSALHLAKDLPNNGYLDLEWDFEKKSAFLRSMDCGKSQILPKPKIILKNREYEILDFVENTQNKLGFDFTLGGNNG